MRYLLAYSLYGIYAFRKHAFYVSSFSFNIDIKSRKKLERLSNLENERKRRNRIYIIAEILTIAKEGSLKTQIMYRANLSFAQLNEYLSFLTTMYLLKIHNENGKKIYRTTAKGNKYLEKYKDIANLLGNNEKDSEPV
jgi:predicted transcriptional regulator